MMSFDGGQEIPINPNNHVDDGRFNWSSEDITYKDEDVHSINHYCACGARLSSRTTDHVFDKADDEGGVRSETCSACGYTRYI
jgi:hypothetical protein